MPYIFKNDYTPEQGEVWADEKEGLFREIFEKQVIPIKGLVFFCKC